MRVYKRDIGTHLNLLSIHPVRGQSDQFVENRSIQAVLSLEYSKSFRVIVVILASSPQR